MAKDQKKQESSDIEPVPAPVLKAAPVQLEQKSAPQVLVSFDRWFASTKRPGHHKAGMQAFAATKGKKTVAAWNAVFARY